jgi:hypothetical protein
MIARAVALLERVGLSGPRHWAFLAQLFPLGAKDHGQGHCSVGVAMPVKSATAAVFVRWAAVSGSACSCHQR